MLMITTQTRKDEICLISWQRCEVNQSATMVLRSSVHDESSLLAAEMKTALTAALASDLGNSSHHHPCIFVSSCFLSWFAWMVR
jgi:hypothetical protein